MGSEYQISGINARLPAANAPATVTFDGIAEPVGAYFVNESIQRTVNDQGQQEAWIDFEFVRNPEIALPLPANSSELAGDVQQQWRVNLANLQLPNGAQPSEFYMYFTENGVPSPFAVRRRRSEVAQQIGEHPFLEDVSVWHGPLTPIKDEDLPPGASNALVTNFPHYFTMVHDVERGLGVLRGADGFHLGYRVTVPEPTTSLLLVCGVIGSAWMPRRKRPSDERVPINA
jgi:hypothetical protein